jgi:hypothetical protein
MGIVLIMIILSLSLSIFSEVGSSKFFRLDDSKVLAWLYHKVCLHLLKLNFDICGSIKLEEPILLFMYVSVLVRPKHF